MNKKIVLKKSFLIFAALYSLCARLAYPARQTPQREFAAVFSCGQYELNPHFAYNMSEAQIMTALYEGLCAYDPYSLEPVPACAESWRESDDSLTWTFTIRRGLKFGNGDVINAAAFRDSWLALLKSAQNPEAIVPYASLLDCVSGAAQYRTGAGLREDVGLIAIDAYTLEVRLDSPAEYLPKILCHYAFSAVHPSMFGKPCAFDFGADAPSPSKSRASSLVSSGPFSLDSAEPDSLLFKKRKAYWDAENTYLPSIKIMFSDDGDKTADLFNWGKAQWIDASVSLDKILLFDAIQLSPMFSTEFFYFRCNDAPWNAAAVRNALIAALPWHDLRADSLIPAKTLIFPIGGYPELDGVEEGENTDVEYLKSELEKALGTPSSEAPALIISIPESDYLRSRSQMIADAWGRLGLTVEIKESPAVEYYSGQKTDPAALRLMVWVGDFSDPMAFLELFRQNSTLNESGWSHPEFESLLKEAANQRDAEKRYETLGGAERVLLDDGVVLPIEFRPSFNVIDLDEIDGWYPNALDVHPFKSVRFAPRKLAPNVI